VLRLLIAAVLLAGAACVCPPAQAADPITRLLPAGAHLLQERPVSAGTDVTAVAYRDGKDYLGLAQIQGATARWIGDYPLPTRFVRFAPRTPPGFTEAVVQGNTPRAMGVCAYAVASGSATPAISGATSCAEGDEGIRLHPDGFTLRRHDASHQGSVRYRLLLRYGVRARQFRVVSERRVPDYPSNMLPLPSATVQTSSGNIDLLRLDVADTEQQRETGLMNRHTLDPDTGMIFVWPGTAPGTYQQVHDSFWMDNTYIPLSIAFLSANGTVQEIDDMQPLTTNLHTPAEPYTFAIEANIGYFAANGIRLGDRFLLHLDTSRS